MMICEINRFISIERMPGVNPGAVGLAPSERVEVIISPVMRVDPEARGSTLRTGLIIISTLSDGANPTAPG